jgi:hypothetical protein
MNRTALHLLDRRISPRLAGELFREFRVEIRTPGVTLIGGLANASDSGLAAIVRYGMEEELINVPIEGRIVGRLLRVDFPFAGRIAHMSRINDGGQSALIGVEYDAPIDLPDAILAVEATTWDV